MDAEMSPIGANHMPVTQPPLERLRTRLYRFNSTGDVTEILGEEVLREIGAVMARPDAQYDLTAIEIVAWLYWYRSQAATGAAIDAKRESATKLFEFMYMSDPASVPGALQSLLRDRRLSAQKSKFAEPAAERPAIDIQATLRSAAELFERYQITGDVATLQDS